MKVESKGGNKYAFDFGGGVETIVADGTFQQGLYGSSLSAKAEAADTWIVARQKDGKLMLRATWKLSADGSTLTDYYREFQPDGSTVSVSMDYVYRRTGTGGPNIFRLNAPLAARMRSRIASASSRRTFIRCTSRFVGSAAPASGAATLAI